MGEGAAENALADMVPILFHVPETVYLPRYLQRQKGKRIDEEVVQLAPELFGRPKAPAGTWASCIRIIDPVEVTWFHYSNH